LAADKYNFEVQTLRLCTNNFGEYMDTSSQESLVQDAKYIEKVCADCGITFVSIGGCRDASSFDQIVQVLANTTNLFCNIQRGDGSAGDENALDGLQSWCEAAAECVQKLSMGSKSESFRFTVCACCPPGIPFFPAAYWETKRKEEDPVPSFSYAFGTENSGLLYEIFREKIATENMQVEGVAQAVKDGFGKVLSPLARLASDLETIVGEKEKSAGGKGQGSAFNFRGVDASVAPGLDHRSIAEAFELFGFGPFGSPGTLAICSMITKGLKSIETVKLCGYSGLMLPVCEDRGLAEAYSKGNITIDNFLQYSSVCGIGLDTFPIAGDTTTKVVSGVLMDVCRLAHKLKKPLSCRLLPCQGKKAGESTAFNSPYLVECKLKSLVPY
jgi:uncharacterized protein (UPF0210 family)